MIHNGPAIVSGTVQALAIFLFLVAALRFTFLLKGCYVLRRQARWRTRDDSAILLKSPLVPAVSAIAVAEDFSPATRGFVRQLLSLHFGEHQVVLVLDRLPEAQVEEWRHELRLERSHRDALPPGVEAIYSSRDPLKLVVARTAPGERSNPLNVALSVAASPVIALIDRESEFAPDCLLRLIRPMLQDPDGTKAVCGIGPSPSGSGFAGIEFLRSWLVRCAAFAGWEMLLPVPGAAILLRRDTILKAGGFTAGPIELFLHLHGLARAKGKKFRVALVPSEAFLPAVPPPVARRRGMRDQAALARAVKHRGSIAKGLFAIGWGLPGLVVSRLVCPLAETAVYLLAAVGLALGWIPLPVLELALLATVGSGILISMAAVVLRELASYRGSEPKQLRRLFFAAIPENLGYRQVRNLWLISAWFRRA